MFFLYWCEVLEFGKLICCRYEWGCESASCNVMDLCSIQVVFLPVRLLTVNFKLSHIHTVKITIELSYVIFLVQDNAKITNFYIITLSSTQFKAVLAHRDQHTSLWECSKSNNTTRLTWSVRLNLSLQKQYSSEKTMLWERIKNLTKSGVIQYKENRGLSTGRSPIGRLEFYF